ncbi:emp24/gp25L/p24 family/GOLD-domain-containing protein [Pelagophyceae sp. CCMP2097]|nr:emp24/gp25L/p24 family/GOLD-domain-containing protein [Pelagophyceae sp. CCMP2097]
MPRVAWVCCLGLLAPCGAVFVLLTNGKKECFVVEEPLDTQLVMQYEIPAAEGSAVNDKAVEVTLKDRRTDADVFHKRVSDHKGEVQLSTVSDAVHDLCLAPAEQWNSPLLFDFNLALGNGERYYDEMAAKSHMDKLQLEVIKLNDELAQILSEADFMKEREVKFHKKSEQVNMAATWWPMLQIIILVLTGILQVKNLKRFFASKNFY